MLHSVSAVILDVRKCYKLFCAHQINAHKKIYNYSVEARYMGIKNSSVLKSQAANGIAHIKGAVAFRHNRIKNRGIVK